MKRAIHTSAPVCGGKLFAWYVEKVGIDAYDALAQQPDQAKDKHIFVTYEHNDLETPINSINDLFTLIRHYGCLPIEEARSHPTEFSIILGFLLGLARGERIIDLADFWDFLDDKFGISVSQLTPRIEGCHLHFTILACIVPEVIAPVYYDSIVKVAVDLNSGAAKKQKIELKPRQVNEFSAIVECPNCRANEKMSFRAAIGVLNHETFESGDLVIKSVPPEPTDRYPIGPSVECDWEQPFWAAGFDWCRACSRALAARIEIRDRRFFAARPTLETLDVSAWGLIHDTP